MPLHLLPKKSYHVYNESNITRVRADEAAAAAAEHEKEQREQAVDAARRLAILRDETPPPLPEPEPEIDPANTKFARRNETSSTGFGARKRKRKGEDDTDFELRMAMERAEAGAQAAGELSSGAGGEKKKRVEIDIVDKDGHIDLVGFLPQDEKSGKNAEYEKDAARKKRELEDQYTMRFSNAAGRDGFPAGDPWYASSSTRQRALAPATATKEDEVGIEAPTRNVWGRADPKRQDREVSRIASNDPLAIMRMGAKKVREIEKERKRENEERAKELKELEREERRKEKRRKRQRREENGGGQRHRSGHSEHSKRHHHNDDREDRRHRQRDYLDRSRDSARREESELDHDRDKERTRDRPRLSVPYADKEDRHSRRRDDR